MDRTWAVRRASVVVVLSTTILPMADYFPKTLAMLFCIASLVASEVWVANNLANRFSSTEGVISTRSKSHQLIVESSIYLAKSLRRKPTAASTNRRPTTNPPPRTCAACADRFLARSRYRGLWCL